MEPILWMIGGAVTWSVIKQAVFWLALKIASESTLGKTDENGFATV